MVPSPEALTAATSDGQAGSAMMVSAMREPRRRCSSGVQAGRSPVLAASRVGGARVPASRHHSAAAGSSSGSGPWRVTASVSRAETSAPARAAASRWVASRGQNGSAVMWASMPSARLRQRWAPGWPRRSAVSTRPWMQLLEGRRAVGVLFGAGDAGVGEVDVVGGAEHRDLGHQLGLLSQQGARPGRDGTGLPGARRRGSGRPVADELGARVQVGAPLGVSRQRVGDGGQPAQRTDPLGGRPVRCRQPPVEHGGEVDGVSQAGWRRRRVGPRWVVAVDGQQGQVAAQHRPRAAVGDVGADRDRGGVDAGHGGRAGECVRRLRSARRCTWRPRVQPVERVVFGGRGAVGGHLGAVAAQDRGEDVDGGRGMGGFGRQDAVRVGFGGGEVDVVFGLAAGEGDVELLAGEPVGADDVAGAVVSRPPAVTPWALSMVRAYPRVVWAVT